MSNEYKERPIPKWERKMHMAFRDHYQSAFRDNALGCQMETVTKRNKHGYPTSSKTYWFIDGDRREFKSEEAMVDAIMKGPAELWVHAGTTRVNP